MRQSSARPFLEKLKPALTRERVICRIIAAWCTFAAFSLIFAGSEVVFTDLSFLADTSMGSLLLCCVLSFLVYTVISVLLPRYETDTWFLLLAATLCVCKWLTDYPGDNNTFLFVLAVLVAYALFLVYFIQRNDLLFEKWKPGKKAQIIVATVCGLTGGTVIAIITCLRYATFSSPNFDFGLFCNMFHYMKETGLPLVTSERNVLLSHFVVHISPIYYLLLPFYFIFPSPMTLQIGQAVILCSGVIPILLLCRHFKLSGKSTLLVCLIYSLYPALSAGCFYDIHENCFLAPLLLWMFYFFEREKYLPMYLFAVGVLMVKEDAAVYVILFALYVLLSKKKYLHGTILAVGAMAWFGVAMLILTKTSSYYAAYYEELGLTASPAIAGPMVNRFNNLILSSEDGLWGAVKTALKNPGYLLTQLFSTSKNTWTSADNYNWEKVVYFLQMFLPLGFIPFCTKKPSRWLLITPILMNLLTMYKYQYDIGFQYQFGITAFLFYAMIQNLPELKVPLRRNLLAFGAAACCCLYIVTVLPSLGTYTERWSGGKDTYRQMDAILDTLPEDASICTTTWIVSHVADRDEVYELNYHGDAADVDYVVVDSRYKNSYKAHIDAYRAQGYVEDPAYADQDLFIILKKGG